MLSQGQSGQQACDTTQGCVSSEGWFPYLQQKPFRNRPEEAGAGGAPGTWLVLASFICLESCGQRVSVRDCLFGADLWACLWGIVQGISGHAQNLETRALLTFEKGLSLSWIMLS